ncbi:uncharacterized protein LOC112538563 [Tetranychus urticae]|uniref:uncharacterized protein LOC112538563 n=1 Tax=Tetranychus urticae TaxID=32264 RepID=UPI000D6482D1|nr:uncharacterized protein LOC112538563 [Tetranychus urticae]
MLFQVKLSKMFNVKTLHCHKNKVFTTDKAKKFLIKAIEPVFGLRLTDFYDADAIKDLKRFESVCISFNILPNGFAQDQSITPSKWTKTRSILYSSLMIVNIFHLILLSVFDLPQDLSLILGDFFYHHPRRRYFWLFWTNLTIFGEVLRHYWIYLYKTGAPFSFHMHNFVYDKGFKPEGLFLSHFYCLKYRFISSNLANLWIRTIIISGISMGPVLIIIVQSASQVPKTSQQFIFTYFWLLTTYLGLVIALTNIMLTGAVITIDLAYNYFRAATEAQAVRNFANKGGVLNKRIYLSEYKEISGQIIHFQNEIEHINLKIRNWLIFLYLGVSYSTNFGFYLAAIVHFDHGPLDIFIGSISILGLFAIGTCSYVNGVILTMMHSCGKNIMKANRYLPLGIKSSIKYLIENASLIMMFKVNVK